MLTVGVDRGKPQSLFGKMEASKNANAGSAAAASEEGMESKDENP